MKNNPTENNKPLPAHITRHPCFSAIASRSYGRIHLPVAPACNIQCNFCIRKFDCVNESRPGVTSRVLKPLEALARVDEVMARGSDNSVVGIAGPGDPLFNPETFETIRLVGEKYPDMLYCLSTNGLLLPDHVAELKRLRVSNVTVTLNTLTPSIGAQIYSFVRYGGNEFHGEEGARLLLQKQLEGIKMAVAAGMAVKVNTVLIKKVNFDEVEEIAKKIGSMGVYIHNLMPVIPQFKFDASHRPSPEEIAHLRETCGKWVLQMKHCRQCRSDAVGRLDANDGPHSCSRSSC